MPLARMKDSRRRAGDAAARRTRSSFDTLRMTRGRAGIAQEVFNDRFAVLAEHRFGMELDAVHGQLAMRDSLHDAVFAAGVDAQHAGNRRGLETERMITRGDQR